MNFCVFFCILFCFNFKTILGIHGTIYDFSDEAGVHRSRSLSTRHEDCRAGEWSIFKAKLIPNSCYAHLGGWSMTCFGDPKSFNSWILFMCLPFCPGACNRRASSERCSQGVMHTRTSGCFSKRTLYSCLVPNVWLLNSTSSVG